jgi:hypothetical protein
VPDWPAAVRSAPEDSGQALEALQATAMRAVYRAAAAARPKPVEWEG